MKPTNEDFKNAVARIRAAIAKNDASPSRVVAGLDLDNILAALESAQAEVTALEKQVDELQTELSKWPT